MLVVVDFFVQINPRIKVEQLRRALKREEIALLFQRQMQIFRNKFKKCSEEICVSYVPVFVIKIDDFFICPLSRMYIFFYLFVLFIN